MSNNKCAIVTGATGGIGSAIVSMMIARGYTVIAMDRKIPEVLPVYEGSGRAVYFAGDVTSQADHDAMVALALAEEGKIDILVNVAGVAPLVRADLLEMTPESYDRVMNINLRGALLLTQRVARQMVSQEREGDAARGYIVNISSCSAYTSSTSRGEYCLSKAGMTMLTMLFADRLAAEGITVNEVCPGVIATDMTAGVKGKYDALIEGGLIPQHRWGQPEDVAKAVMALCDGTLGYTTGQSIIVDGGMHIRRL